jgi:radical SAM superfamily enzyme YgiQ (UPF0313 family)
MTSKVQFTFPNHTSGQLAHNPSIPPPVGALTLAAYLKETSGASVEVYDGNKVSSEEFVNELNAPWQAISVWFSNYSEGIALAKKIKHQNEKAKIILGGPHVNGLEKRILKEHDQVDFVISGDGESPLAGLIQGSDLERIPGLSYRSGDDIISNPKENGMALDLIPPFDLNDLKTGFTWDKDAIKSDQDALPLSGVRGCLRVKRCDYCAIPTLGVRTVSAQKYWDQIKSLQDSHGVDMFFETGDILPPKFIKALANAPQRQDDVYLKAYLYPGMSTPRNVENLVNAGVKKVFIGVENILVWGSKSFSQEYTRTYARSYTPDSLLKEIEALGKAGIGVMPSFLFGMPGETEETLEENRLYASRIISMPNIKEFNINSILPLPGTKYFDDCMENPEVFREYMDLTGINLHQTADLNYSILSGLFVDAFSDVSYTQVCSAIDTLVQKESPSSRWGATPGGK